MGNYRNAWAVSGGCCPVDVHPLVTQGSSQKKLKEGVVLRSKHVCGFSDHIKEMLPQKGGGGGGGALPLWLDPSVE